MGSCSRGGLEPEGFGEELVGAPARGDVIVAATGVTAGALLKGVRFTKDVIETETVVYRSATGTVRRIQAEHREFAKFHLD